MMQSLGAMPREPVIEESSFTNLLKLRISKLQIVESLP
jgi:hypothetical protein